MTEENKVSEKEKKDSSALKVMFPGKDIPLGNGEFVRVTPLSLEELPGVIKSFSSLVFQAVSKDPAQIAVDGITEVLELLPKCVNREVGAIPSPAVPFIVEAVIDLNLTDAAVGKWMALFQKLMKLKDQGEGAGLLDQGQKKKEVKTSRK